MYTIIVIVAWLYYSWLVDIRNQFYMRAHSNADDSADNKYNLHNKQKATQFDKYANRLFEDDTHPEFYGLWVKK